MAQLRIVSLISSATEIACELGLRSNLVGISHECDYPPEIKGLPVLSEPSIDPSRPSREIDSQVRSAVAKGLSIYQIRGKLLEELKPDLILTQDQCEVCAVSLKDVEQAVCALTLTQTRICSLHPNDLADISGDFLRVGAATGTKGAARDLVTRFQDRLKRLGDETKAKVRPRVLLLEWLEPLIVAGGWMPEIARLAGGEPLLVTDASPFKKISWEEAYVADPDIVVILPCGYDLKKTEQELLEPRAAAALGRFRAARQGRIFLADGNAYFNRPGPRIADSAEILASLFHPGRPEPRGATRRYVE